MSQEKLLFSFVDDEIYGYPIKFDVYGNQNQPGKQIELGNGSLLNTSPGWQVTVSTDRDDVGDFQEQVTLNITGTVKTTPTEDGGFIAEYRGHNLIYDPVDGGTPNEAWFKYATGKFTYQADANNDAIVDLHGDGQLTELTDFFLV